MDVGTGSAVPNYKRRRDRACQASTDYNDP
jgi:hypothetical protein